MTTPIDISPVACTADSPGEAEQAGGALSIPRLGVRAVDISPEAVERLAAVMMECGRCGGSGVDPCGGDCRRCGGSVSAERESGHTLRALRTALTASESRMQWQPIGTAPVGQEILLWHKKWLAVGYGCLDNERQAYSPDDSESSEFSPQPTHWMILPEAPK